MFNLVKWAFKLGQQTERHRIANILEQSRKFIPYREGLTNNQLERQKREEAIARAVSDIIDNITRPQSTDMETYSLLFPKDGK